MKKGPTVYLRDVEESIESIESYVKGKDREEFLSNKMLQDAVIRRIEIIGEAVKNLPDDFTKRHPEVHWSNIARTRDKLIHGYSTVDLNIAFDVVEDDLPALRKQISKILKGL